MVYLAAPSPSDIIMVAATKFAGPSHARFYSDWLDLPSYRNLHPPARALLLETMARYRPKTSTQFEWSSRKAAGLLLCSRSTAAQALHELVECGWLKVERVGRTKGPRATRPSVYSLTMFGTAMDPTPSREFMTWRPVAQ